MKLTTWLFIFLILTGLTLAFFPDKKQNHSHKKLKLGIIAAFIAGLGQGFGATTSRIAERIALHDDTIITGISQAFQRVFAGMVFLAVIYAVKRIFSHKKTSNTQNTSR